MIIRIFTGYTRKECIAVAHFLGRHSWYFCDRSKFYTFSEKKYNFQPNLEVQTQHVRKLTRNEILPEYILEHRNWCSICLIRTAHICLLRSLSFLAPLHHIDTFRDSTTFSFPYMLIRSIICPSYALDVGKQLVLCRWCWFYDWMHHGICYLYYCTNFCFKVGIVGAGWNSPMMLGYSIQCIYTSSSVLCCVCRWSSRADSNTRLLQSLLYW